MVLLLVIIRLYVYVYVYIHIQRERERERNIIYEYIYIYNIAGAAGLAGRRTGQACRALVVDSLFDYCTIICIITSTITITINRTSYTFQAGWRTGQACRALVVDPTGSYICPLGYDVC